MNLYVDNGDGDEDREHRQACPVQAAIIIIIMRMMTRLVVMETRMMMWGTSRFALSGPP